MPQALVVVVPLLIGGSGLVLISVLLLVFALCHGYGREKSAHAARGGFAIARQNHAARQTATRSNPIHPSYNAASATGFAPVTAMAPQVIENYGDPDRNRTCDLQIRNLPLYPTELRDHAARHITASDRFAKRRSVPNQPVSTMADEA